MILNSILLLYVLPMVINMIVIYKEDKPETIAGEGFEPVFP